MRRFLIATLACLACVPASVTSLSAQTQAPARPPDVIYVGTPPDVVEAMLRAAKVGPNDVVYDLGCGDGRIPIAAARLFGARGVGVDIDPQRIKEATANAEKAGVSDRVKFFVDDLLTADISNATVVAIYLIPSLNEKLRPRLLKELKPGSRLVSHAFDMGDGWPPEEELNVNGRRVFLWTIPKP